MSSCLLANAGTPLMWASAFHLLLGNLLIGLFEGWLLARIYKTPSKRYLLVMVLANYFSCIAGGIGVAVLGPPIEDFVSRLNPIHAGWRLILLGALGTYFATILIEWPFCAWTLRKVTVPLHAGLRGSFIAQTVSYVLLIPFFASCSTLSVYTTGNLQRDYAFVKPPIGVMYYINPDDGAVWRMKTDGTERTRFVGADLDDEGARLFAKPSPTTDRSFDLWCVSGVENEKPRRLSENIGSAVAPREITELDEEPNTWENTVIGEVI